MEKDRLTFMLGLTSAVFLVLSFVLLFVIVNDAGINETVVIDVAGRVR